MRRLYLTALFLAATVLCFICRAALEQDIEAQTGAKTRIAWANGGSGDNGNLIYGIDTRDNQGIRCIVNVSSNVSRIDISPSGQEIVYSSGDNQIWAVKWDGTNRRKLRDNFMTSVWKGPDGADWVLFIPNISDGQHPISRCKLSDPNATANVIDKPVGWGFFNLSADGKFGGIEYQTWGNIGVVDIQTGNYASYYQGQFGCQCQIAPDNSYFFTGITEFTGAHHPTFHTFNHSGVDLGTFGPPSGKVSIGNPRWAYSATKSRVIMLVSNDPNDDAGDVYLYKFNDVMTSAQAKLKVSSTGNCRWPAAWIDPGASAAAPVTATPNRRGIGVVVQKNGRIVVHIATPGDHAVTLLSANGAAVASVNGRGNAACAFDEAAMRPGVYAMKISAPAGTETRRIVVRR
jgi:hypothetical protein